MQPPQRPETEHANGLDPKTDDYTLQQVTDFLFRPESMVVLVLLVFIASRLWLLLALDSWISDIHNYSQFARHGIDCNELAYRDFLIEYPPIAWWLMAVPRFFDSETYQYRRPFPETVERFYNSYRAWFHFELLLADIACFGMMFLIGRRISSAAKWWLPAFYAMLSIAQPHLIYDRLDIVLLLFFLLFVYCWQRSLESSPAAFRWSLASYLFLGLGISFKVMPVIFVPFLLLADLWAGSARRFGGRVLALAAGALGPFLIYLPSTGWGVFGLIQYHSERGVHMESIWGSVMLVGARLGVPCRVSESHAAYDVIGDWGSMLKIVSAVLLVAAPASLGLWALLRGRRFDRLVALDTAYLALVNCTVVAHIFSPQYLNWLLPLALLLALNVFPRSWGIWCVFAALVFAIVGISSWIFPSHFWELIRLEAAAVVLSIIRSVCLVALAVLLNVRFFATYGLVPWRPAHPAPDAVAMAT